MIHGLREMKKKLINGMNKEISYMIKSKNLTKEFKL
jgi:hypothetical protein